MPFDVQFGPPQNTVTNIVPGRFEIDFSGTGGSLSDGTITIGGYDFTLTGIGSSASTFTIPLADLFPSYDGSKHSVEIIADIDRGTWTEVTSVCQIARRTTSDASGAGNAMMFYYSTASDAFFQVSSDYDGSAATSFSIYPYATLEPKRLGLIAAGRASVGTARNVTTGSPARVAEDAAAYNWVVNDGTPNATNPFGAGDYLQVWCYKYNGAAGTTTATQNASGINFAIGSSDFTLKKLYVYIGTEDIT